jgi:hypothetical protein
VQQLRQQLQEQAAELKQLRQQHQGSGGLQEGQLPLQEKLREVGDMVLFVCVHGVLDLEHVVL